MNTAPQQDNSPRLMVPALRRGLSGVCPHCGEGRLFSSYLKVTPNCATCGEDLSHQRADDLPAYIVLFIVGHIVVGLLMTVETYFEWPIWLQIVIWPLLTLILSLSLLQPIKGAVVALQWAARMHGFGTTPDGDDNPRLKPANEAIVKTLAKSPA